MPMNSTSKKRVYQPSTYKRKLPARRRMLGSITTATEGVPVQGRNFARAYISRSPFPPRVVRTMRFCNSLALNSNTTQAACGTENVWRLNSCFDPDLTGGTHQPYGFDQMAALYAKYTVMSVRIRIIVSNAVSTLPSAIGIIVQPPTSTFVLTGVALSDVIEKSMGDVMWLDSTGTVKEFASDFKIARIAGITDTQMKANIEDYSALVSASPSSTPYLRIAYANFASTAQIGVSAYIILDYTTEFYDRIDLASSN